MPWFATKTKLKGNHKFVDDIPTATTRDSSRKLAKAKVTMGKSKQVGDTTTEGFKNDASEPERSKKPVSEERLAQHRAMGKKLVKEGMKIGSSYSLGVITVADQAALEPDFLGKDVGWYNLDYAGARRYVHGEYLIVFARNTGVIKPGGEKTVEIFDVSMKNCLEIYTKKREDEGDDAHLAQLMAEGYFAGAFLRAGDKSLSMAIDHEDSAPCTAAVTIQQRDEGHRTCVNFLEKIIQSRIRRHGSTIEFGIKSTGQAQHVNSASEYDWVELGFEFAKLELAHTNPLTRGSEILEVVAVKIPERGNVGSAFILKQKLLNLPNPVWVCEPEEDVESGENKNRDAEMLV